MKRGRENRKLAKWKSIYDTVSISGNNLYQYRGQDR